MNYIFWSQLRINMLLSEIREQIWFVMLITYFLMPEFYELVFETVFKNNNLF